MDWQNLTAAVGNMQHGEAPGGGPYDFHGGHDHNNLKPQQDARPGASAAAAAAAAAGRVGPLLTDHEGFSDFHAHFQNLSPSAAPAVGHLDADAQKAKDQRYTAQLRAKLLEKMPKTPAKAASVPGQAPPPSTTAMFLPFPPLPPLVPAGLPPTTTTWPPQLLPPSANPQVNGTAPHKPDSLALAAMIAEEQAKSGAAQQVQPPPVKKASPSTNVSGGTAQTQAQVATTAQADHPPTQLKDSYYADLAAWLDFTGYHNVSYRTAKLRTYKERRALEEEAERIQDRLAQLKQEEEAEMGIMRAKTTHPSTGANVNAAPPALPAEMPSRDAQVVAEATSKVTNGVPSRDAKVKAEAKNKVTNGVKRLHSPPRNDRVTRQKNDTGFRILSANDSTSGARPPSSRRDERRVSYPEPRRSSDDLRRSGLHAPSRDPSLERRQAHYKRDGERGGPPLAGHDTERYDSFSSGRRGGHGGGGRGGHERYGASSGRRF
ncbi:zinc finger protein CCCH domain-containing protein 45 [Teratosphaeria destructans]|uniref:Zinc finger protein CCCH domain-containing protein 45 n=1 Tax=Teratosphaeria destructans TaxID=418781 RepID=A0A9W7SXR4_9PEZI|nr:zinc finger protein CCCH domain-containing protein 45 [Teratosphaeria destructans]